MLKAARSLLSLKVCRNLTNQINSALITRIREQPIAISHLALLSVSKLLGSMLSTSPCSKAISSQSKVRATTNSNSLACKMAATRSSLSTWNTMERNVLSFNRSIKAPQPFGIDKESLLWLEVKNSASCNPPKTCRKKQSRPLRVCTAGQRSLMRSMKFLKMLKKVQSLLEMQLVTPQANLRHSLPEVRKSSPRRSLPNNKHKETKRRRRTR